MAAQMGVKPRVGYRAIGGEFYENVVPRDFDITGNG